MVSCKAINFHGMKVMSDTHGICIPVERCDVEEMFFCGLRFAPRGPGIIYSLYRLMHMLI